MDSQLSLQVSDKINNNMILAKNSVNNVTNAFVNLLTGKITEKYKNINSEVLQIIFNETARKLNQEFSNWFSNFQISEIEFYEKNLKTADLIFNASVDKRNQRIYLDNLMKKIDSKPNENLDNLFQKTANMDNQITTGPSIEKILSSFKFVLLGNSKLSLDESEELSELINSYVSKYTNDILAVFNNFLSANRENCIFGIESEIEKRNIRNGKSRAVAMLERKIINDSQQKMDGLLVSIISDYKNTAAEELKICSTTIIDVIFKLLPSKYQDQRGLLEIIIDTNINERLGSVMDTEIDKLALNLQFKNHDIINNELYEEKRYKDIPKYEFNFDLINKIYQDVLHEISISYDMELGENERNVINEIKKSYNIGNVDNQHLVQSNKRLNLIVLSEIDSVKEIFKNLINAIIAENNKNLRSVVTEMNTLSREAKLNKFNDTGRDNTENTGSRRII